MEISARIANGHIAEPFRAILNTFFGGKEEMSLYEYGGPFVGRRDIDDAPDQCEQVTDVHVHGGREHTFICGGIPEFKCANRQCGGHICSEHVATCEECDRDFHDDVRCLPIGTDKRRVCMSCSLSLEECEHFGQALPEAA